MIVMGPHPYLLVVPLISSPCEYSEDDGDGRVTVCVRKKKKPISSSFSFCFNVKHLERKELFSLNFLYLYERFF